MLPPGEYNGLNAAAVSFFAAFFVLESSCIVIWMAAKIQSLDLWTLQKHSQIVLKRLTGLRRARRGDCTLNSLTFSKTFSPVNFPSLQGPVTEIWIKQLKFFYCPIPYLSHTVLFSCSAPFAVVFLSCFYSK